MGSWGSYVHLHQQVIDVREHERERKLLQLVRCNKLERDGNARHLKKEITHIKRNLKLFSLYLPAFPYAPDSAKPSPR